MNKIAYLKCPTGISGDMCLGALVDSGVPLAYLRQQLSLLGLDDEFQLSSEKVIRNGQTATKVNVEVISLKDDHSQYSHSHHHKPHHDPIRHLPEIESIITQSNLPDGVKQLSLNIFRNLAIAEGAVHGISPDQVHFHEVGATDAIVDIVGTCLGLNWLGIEKLYCSSLPTGGGMVKAAHGQLCVPVPAVLKLWETRQVPVYSNGIEKELVTPTGAAITVTLVENFGNPPPLKIEKIGLGAGNHNLTIPNILQLWLGTTLHRGETSEELNYQNLETITVLETQIDDLSPQGISYTMNSLFSVGALDVFTQPIVMKKNRLGVLLTVICTPENMTKCEEIIFKETTTLGIRRLTQERNILHREFMDIETIYGIVKIKIGYQLIGEEKRIINVQPEYDDCVTLAKKHKQSWREIHQTALETWRLQD
jgi:pyridinium-3,5-bisthiocarboxylic acid mononucleotide nickel chelatase